MKPIDSLNIQDIVIETITTNKQVQYLNIESAFDIETTSCYVNNNQKFATMYSWMWGIKNKDYIYYGRTWEEAINLFNHLTELYNLSEHRRLVVYIQNLSYEFQFMRKYFEWENVFAVGDRKPIKALTSGGIEFRDSYILSGFSLAKTADNLVNHTIEKLTGDLDYSLTRHHETPLTPKELAYMNNDIEIILDYINEQINQYGDITKIPLTNTGRVRRYVRNNCYYTGKSHRKTNKGKYTRYRNIMRDLTLTTNDYKQLKQAFMGGFTHANALYSGETLEQVSSIDFTSSYPSVMVAEKYPMSRAIPVNNIKSEQDLINLMIDYAVLLDIKFINLKPKIDFEHYISESKCYLLKDPLINNGRVVEASELAMTLTDVDFRIIKQVYTWDSLSIHNVKKFHRGYLPKAIIESILTIYQDKTVLKDVAGAEVEYLLSKGMLNSVYGMSVTDPVNMIYDYSDDLWNTELPDLDQEIEKYNKSKNRFLFYAWGIWVTAYARLNLWTGIIQFKDDYIYSDTDSIKLLNLNHHQDYINRYNELTLAKLKATTDYYNLDYALITPKTQEGIEKPLGIWDYEGTADKFKTLGAKRYLTYKDNKLELTVAGLSKRNGINYMLEQAGQDIDKVFDSFTHELFIPAEETGKSTHTYIDFEQTAVLKDYLGNYQEVTSLSGVHLEPAEFTLKISSQYMKYLDQFLQGELYKGVDFQ